MMQQEFEAIAKIRVTAEDYNTIIEPMYLATGLSKADFVKTLNLKFFASRVPKPEKNIKKMHVRSRDGSGRTPNGCWYYIEYVELVDVSIRTGKYIVRPLDDEDLQKIYRSGHSLDLSGDFDMDYTQCIDSKTKKPVTLRWDF